MNGEIDKRGKLVLSRADLHRLLGLSGDIKVTGFYTTNDPKYLMVELIGDPLARESDWVFPIEDCEMRVVHLDEVR